MPTKVLCKSKTPLVLGNKAKCHARALRVCDGSKSTLPSRVVRKLHAEGRCKIAQSKGERSVSAGAFLSLDQGALSSASGTTYKLVLLCALITKLMRIQMLPKDTPVILSKVSFNVLLPCLLCSKVAGTLNKIGTPSMLGIPVIALAQIAVGIFAGSVIYGLFLKIINRNAVQVPELAMAAGSGSTTAADQTAEMAERKAKEAKSEALKNIVKAASGFGNSVTLPLIFFSSLLPAAQYDRAAGYTALFLIGWSPALWSMGYRMFVHTEEDKVEVEGEQSAMEKVAAFVVDIAKTLRSYVNPPLLGVLCGMAIGLTPLSNIFFPSKEFLAGSAMVTKFFIGIPKGAMELVELLATALLAIQTMVLAASIIPADGAKGEGVSVKELLLPASKEEVGALFIVLFVRFVIMPLTGIGLLTAFQDFGWLPVDPICYLAVLVQAVMPSAQNIVLLLQLQASTRPLAPTMAKLLLRVYLLAVVPLALWMGVLLPKLGLNL